MASTPGRTVGGINFSVSMDTKKLSKDVKKSRGMIAGFGREVKRALVPIGLLGTAAAGAFGVMVKAQFKAGDALAKMSDKLGVTTEAMAGLQHAASLTGVESSTLEKALVNLTKASNQAARGFGEGVRSFEMLGLSAKALNELSPDKQFLAIADSIAKMTNKQDQLTVATELFGARGASLINTLKLGRDGLLEMAAEAGTLGLAISRVEAAKLEEANDAIERMTKSFSGLAMTAAVELAPAISKIADDIRGLVTDAKGGGFFSGLSKAVGLIKSGFLGLRVIVTKSISAAVSGINAFAKAIAAVLRSMQNLPGVGKGLGKAADSLGGGFLNELDDALKRKAAAGVVEFRDSLKARPQQGPAAEKKKDTPTLESTTAAAGGLLKAVLGKAQGFAASSTSALDSVFGPTVNRARSLLATPKDREKAKAAAGGARGTEPASGGLAFAQAGSAESFRQQARIRRQAEAGKLDKERNKHLRAMADALTVNKFLIVGEAGL